MKGFLSSLADALSFLTLLPFSCPLPDDQAVERMTRALAWFPLAGALVGGLSGMAAWGAWHLWGQAIGAWVALAAMALLTGGLHLDGFADTMDGLGAWKGREGTLEVMRDSRLGVMGAAGLVFLLSLQWSALRQVSPAFWPRALAALGALSRLCLVLSAQFFPYVPGRQGIGRRVTDRRSPLSVAAACGLGLGICALCLGSLRFFLLSVASAVALTWGLSLFFRRWLGGITGDTLGAVNELVELAVLLTLVAAG